MSSARFGCLASSRVILLFVREEGIMSIAFNTPSNLTYVVVNDDDSPGSASSPVHINQNSRSTLDCADRPCSASVASFGLQQIS